MTSKALRAFGSPVALLASSLLAACVLDNLEYDAPTESAATGDPATTSASAGSTGAGSTGISASATGTGTGTASGSTTSDGETSDGSSGPVSASEGTTGTTTIGTTSTTGTSSSTTEATSTTDNGTTEEPPLMMHLQHYEMAQCTDPLWCIYGGNVNAPADGRVFAQECFTGLTPPYRITRVGYVIDQNKGPPADPAIAFRTYVNNAPSIDPFNVVTLQLDQVSPGYHQIDVDVVADEPAFCVGLAGGSKYGTSMGIAVDKAFPPAGQSWYRHDGEPNCTFNSFVDIGVLKPVPTGQWCIDAYIEQL